jgi:hypothetical protein
MKQSREFYRVTLSNNQVIELQKGDVDILKMALAGQGRSVEVTLPGEGNNKITIYTKHVVSIEASGLVRRGIGFTRDNVLTHSPASRPGYAHRETRQQFHGYPYPAYNYADQSNQDSSVTG